MKKMCVKSRFPRLQRRTMMHLCGKISMYRKKLVTIRYFNTLL